MPFMKAINAIILEFSIYRLVTFENYALEDIRM